MTDERLVEAAGVTIARLGPAFGLADVAAEAGVTAGTLVHRFGSKHGLLMAMLNQAISSVMAEPDSTDHDDPVAAIQDAIVNRYAPLDNAKTAANNVAQLAFELADDELRAGIATLYSATENTIKSLVGQAIAAGDLAKAPSAAIAARILANLAEGSAIRWSTQPRGSLRKRLRVELAAVLAGWS